MKDKDVEKNLEQNMSGESARESFRQQVLRDSTAELARVCRRRKAWSRAKIAAAAVLIAGIAFLGGLSMRPESPAGDDIRYSNAHDGVSVPDELVEWLQAARFFGQLGMEDRMARAVERASRLLPADAIVGEVQAVPVLAAEFGTITREVTEPMDAQGPGPSSDSISQILAQSFGD